MSTRIYSFILVILCFLPVLPLFRPGYFPMHDDMQAMRVYEMTKCFQDWQIPCRWVPDMGYGYGYPQFNYYPPFPYYLMTLIHLVGVSILASVKMGFILSFLVAGLGMYLLSRKYFSNLPSLVTSIAYLYLPYRAVNVYVRGAMGEVWAMAFFPWIIWGIDRYWQKRDYLSFSFLAITISCLLTSHLLSAMVIFPLVIVWILFKFFHQKSFSLIIKLFLASILGLLLSSYYVFPALLESKFVHIETLAVGYFSYYNHYVSLGQMFFDSTWGYGSSEVGPYDGMSFQFGIWHWASALISLFVAFKTKFKWQSITLISIFFFYAFLIHPRSMPIWDLLTPMHMIQFPWRLLSAIGLILSFLIGITLNVAKNPKFTAGVVIFLIVFFNLNFFRPKSWLAISDADKFSGELWQKQRTISIFDYLPKSAKYPPADRAPDQPTDIYHLAKISNYQHTSNSFQFQVDSLQPSLISIPIFYFPGWNIKLNGQSVPISHDETVGSMLIDLPSGGHIIFGQLHSTLIQKMSNYLSLIAILITIYLLSYKKIIKK